MRSGAPFTRGLRLALSFLAAACLASASPAQAFDFVTMGGLNLSSPRTSVSSTYPFSNFFGAAGGIGFDFHLAGNAHAEPELLYLTRRYGGFASMPTLMLPLLGRFETRFIIVGIGPYLGWVMGESADNGQPTTLTDFNSVEVGGVLELGLKLPLTQKLTGLLDGRVTRALTPAYDQVTGSFYWGQIEAFVGFQFRISRSSTSALR